MALATFLQPLFNTRGKQRTTSKNITRTSKRFLFTQFPLRKSYQFLFPLPRHNIKQSLRPFQKDACPSSPRWGTFPLRGVSASPFPPDTGFSSSPLRASRVTVCHTTEAQEIQHFHQGVLEMKPIFSL